MPVCLVCNKRAYSDYCVQHKPKKPIKSSIKPLKRTPLPPPRKRINQRGKVAKQWTETRNQWFIDNPAEFYVCYLCKKLIPKNETTLDHKIPRSRSPSLRFDPSNLAPCCWTCNGAKGSRVIS